MGVQCNRNRNRKFIKRHSKSEALPTRVGYLANKKRGFQALAEQVEGKGEEVGPKGLREPVPARGAHNSEAPILSRRSASPRDD